jgi:hypothetical protein
MFRGGRGSTRAWRILLATALAVGSETALAQGVAADAGTGYPDNPVSDYVDRSSDGLTSVEVPSSASSLSSVEVKTPDAEPVKTQKPAEWMLVPIPGYNPSLGFMVTAMGAYIFPADEKSPPSTVGGFGMYSTNNSWVVGAIAKLNLAEDRYRVQAFAMVGHINWDFYGIGNEAADRGQSIPISQGMVGGRLESLFRSAGPLPRPALDADEDAVDGRSPSSRPPRSSSLPTPSWCRGSPRPGSSFSGTHGTVSSFPGAGNSWN